MKNALLLFISLFFAGSSIANTVSGTVTKGTTGNAAYPATAYLIKKSYNSSTSSYVLTLLDSAATNSNGEYRFDSVTVSVGDLLVKAALTPANADYVHYLPTYKENSLNWSTAHAVSFTLGANNIHLVHGTNSGGPAFVGGSVLMGANKTTGVGDPLPQRIIMITDINDNAIAYTYSDAMGMFSFTGLPYGTYKLFGDAMGKANPALAIIVDATHATVNDIVFQENSSSFTGSEQTAGVQNVTAANTLKIYPNPVSGQLNISGVTIGTNIELVSMVGKVIYSSVADQSAATIITTKLAAGNYMLQLTGPTGIKSSYKLVKE